MGGGDPKVTIIVKETSLKKLQDIMERAELWRQEKAGVSREPWMG